MWTQASKVGVHAKSKGHVDGRMQLKEKAMQLKIDATKSGKAMIKGELHIYSIFFPTLGLSPYYLNFFPFLSELSYLIVAISLK